MAKRDYDASYLRDRVVEFMNLFTADFNRPKSCAKPFIGASNFIVTECITRPRGRIVKRKYHSLWRTVMKFFLLPRTEKDLAALKLRLNYCSCSNGLDGLHKAGEHLYRQNLTDVGNLKVPKSSNTVTEFDVMAVSLLRCIHRIFEDVDVNKTLKGDSENWPTSIEDFFPFGPETTVKSLCLWVSALDSLVPAELLGWTVDICRIRVFPALREPHKAAGDIAELLWFSCTHLLESKNDEEWTYRCKTVRTHTKHTQLLMSAGTSYCSDDFAFFVAGAEARFIQMYSLLIYLWTCPRFVFFEKADKMYTILLTNFGSFFVSRIQESDIALLGPVHPWLLERAAQTDDPRKPRADTLETHVYNIVHFSKDQVSCDAPGCTNSFHSAGGYIQTCGKCRVSSYCSTDCQKASWDHPGVPHKEVCSSLYRLKSYMDSSGDMEKAKPGTTKSTFSPDVIKGAGITDDEVMAIAKHFYYSRDADKEWPGQVKQLGKVNVAEQITFSGIEEMLAKVPGYHPEEELSKFNDYNMSVAKEFIPELDTANN